MLSCGCLGRELGEKKSKRELNNSFSATLTPQVSLSKSLDLKEPVLVLLGKFRIEHTANTAANARLTTDMHIISAQGKITGH